MTDNNKKTRNYVFTMNNYTDEKITQLTNICKNFAYICWEKEIGEKCKTPHLQGYFEMKDAKTMSALQKGWLKNLGMSLQVAKGNAKQNITYCSKANNGSFIEHGEHKKQGKRTDLKKLRDEIIDGTNNVDNITLNKPKIYHQYGRTLEKIEDIAMRKQYRTTMTKGTWFWGHTGVGKSHAAYKGFTPETHYVLNVNDNGWWEGYTQQPTVIINEFRGQITFGELLDLVDKWPKTVKRRNRQPMPFTSEHIIITSSMHPHEIYKNVKNTQESLAQLDRRFTIIQLTTPQNIAQINCTKVVRGGNIDPPSLLSPSTTSLTLQNLTTFDNVLRTNANANQLNDELTDEDIININIANANAPIDYDEF